MSSDQHEQRPEVRTLDPKVIATLKARAALSGVEMYIIDGDCGEPVFVMTKWAMTRQLSTTDEVEEFLGRIGGRG